MHLLVCIAFTDNRCGTGPSKGGPAAPPPPPPGSLFQPKGPTAATPAASASSSGMSAVFSELNKVHHLSALQAIRHPGSQFCIASGFSGRITMLSGKDFVTSSRHCELAKAGGSTYLVWTSQKHCLNRHVGQRRIKRGV